MAAGKTRIGQQLAKLSERPFFDLDHVIEKKQGRSIPEIFEEEGEGFYRSLEETYLSKLVKKAPSVLSLGGGALRPATLPTIRQAGVLIFIATDFDVIIARLIKDQKRPKLLDSEGNKMPEEQLRAEMNDLYQSRLPLYHKADIRFEPDPELGYHDNAERLFHQIAHHE